MTFKMIKTSSLHSSREKTIECQKVLIQKHFFFRKIYHAHLEPFGQFTSNFSESMIHLLFFYKLLTLCWFQSSFFYPKSFKKCKTRKGFSTQSFVCNMINIGTLLQMKWGCIVLNTCQIHLIVISRAKKLVQGRNISDIGMLYTVGKPRSPAFQ